MTLTNKTVVTKDTDITGTTVHVKVTVTDIINHELLITDATHGGAIKVMTSASISELKQALVDAGY